MIEPYYEADGITIYHGDCREILPLVHADIMVTDPPYGISYSTGHLRKDDPRNQAIENDDDPEVRNEILRLWGDKSALVFGTWKIARPDNVRQLLIWDKGDSPGMGDLTLPWGPGHEEIYVFGHDFAGKRKSNVLRHPTLSPTDRNRPAHPTPKPIPLMEDLVSYCLPEAVIVDPFMGSGSTLRAAKNLHRKAIGIEVEERYCEMAANGLGQLVFNFG